MLVLARKLTAESKNWNKTYWLGRPAFFVDDVTLACMMTKRHGARSGRHVQRTCGHTRRHREHSGEAEFSQHIFLTISHPTCIADFFARCMPTQLFLPMASPKNRKVSSKITLHTMRGTAITLKVDMLQPSEDKDTARLIKHDDMTTHGNAEESRHCRLMTAETRHCRRIICA